MPSSGERLRGEICSQVLSTKVLNQVNNEVKESKKTLPFSENDWWPLGKGKGKGKEAEQPPYQPQVKPFVPKHPLANKWGKKGGDYWGKKNKGKQNDSD